MLYIAFVCNYFCRFFCSLTIKIFFPKKIAQYFKFPQMFMYTISLAIKHISFYTI